MTCVHKFISLFANATPQWQAEVCLCLQIHV